jgi:cytochrome P450
VFTTDSELLRAGSQFREAMRQVESVVLEEVRARRAKTPAGHETEHEDIFSMLELAHSENGSPIGEEKMRDELVTMLSDGPTATSLAWVFERLLRYPDKLARLREEGCRARAMSISTRSSRRRCACVPPYRSSCGGWSSRCASTATRSCPTRSSRRAST